MIEGNSAEKATRVLNFGKNHEEVYKQMARKPGPAAAQLAKHIAAEVGQNLDPTRHGSEVTLLFGMIQSGKTGALTQSLALAADNGFRIFLVLTMDNEALYEQTATRLEGSFPLMQFFRKSQIKTNTRKAALAALIEEAKGTGPGTVIFCSKNSQILEHAFELFKQAKASDVPTVIFDDEADQASLDGNAFKKLKGDKGSDKDVAELTKVHKGIKKIREYFSRNAYVGVTATPQALFLQKEGALHRPKYHVVIPHGTEYQGGEYFFLQNETGTYREVPVTEVKDYLKNSIIIKKTPLPEGMRDAVVTFFVAAAFGIDDDEKAGRDRDKYSMLLHISMSQQAHEKLLDGINQYRAELAKKLAAKDYPPELSKAYEDIAATAHAVGRHVPTLDKTAEIIQGFGNTAKVLAVNAKTTGTMDFTKLENYRPFNIFIGGNVLGRGMTIHGLITTYYGRDSNQPQVDTVMQHARWYGYRKNLEPYIRVFAPKPVWKRFLDLHQHDIELRAAAIDYMNNDTDIMPLLVPEQLNPTRSNVLEPGSLGTYAGGVTVYQKLPNAERSGKATEEIDQFLEERLAPRYGKPHPEKTERFVGFVTMEEAIGMLDHLPTSPHKTRGTWNDEAIQQAMRTVCAALKHKKVRVVWGWTMDRARSTAKQDPGHITSYLLGEDYDDQKIVERPADYDPPGETCEASTLYLFRVDRESSDSGLGWGDPPWNLGDPLPKTPTYAPKDFYVPGFHPPRLISGKGYGISFRLP